MSKIYMYIGKFRGAQCISSRNRGFHFFRCCFHAAIMELIRVLLLSVFSLVPGSYCSPYPGNTHHHVHHRIHVPHKIKTVYHTKIIKVPEHHHYFHEKEKIIQVEVPKKKDSVYPSLKDDPIYPPLKEEDVGDFSDFDTHEYYGESRHNVVKKRPSPAMKKLRKRKVYRPRH